MDQENKPLGALKPDHNKIDSKGLKEFFEQSMGIEFVFIAQCYMYYTENGYIRFNDSILLYFDKYLGNVVVEKRSDSQNLFSWEDVNFVFVRASCVL